VDADGRVTIWAVTSTISGNGDVGADPNRLVAVRDELKNTSTSVASREKFTTLRAAGFAEVLVVCRLHQTRMPGIAACVEWGAGTVPCICTAVPAHYQRQ
jgi:hypothetical protein